LYLVGILFPHKQTVFYNRQNTNKIHFIVYNVNVIKDEVYVIGYLRIRDLINARKMEHIKIINDRQAETAYAYKNMKQKMPKMKANI